MGSAQIGALNRAEAAAVAAAAATGTATGGQPPTNLCG